MTVSTQTFQHVITVISVFHIDVADLSNCHIMMKRVHSTWAGAFTTKAWTKNARRQRMSRAGQLVEMASNHPINTQPIQGSSFERRLLLKTQMIQLPGRILPKYFILATTMFTTLIHFPQKG
jgi:hypothetical protein